MAGVKPKWIVVLGIAVCVEQAIGAGTVKLTNMIPDLWIPTVVAWNQALAFLGTTIMTAMSAYSSDETGPLMPK